jgi:hypothetical protein
MGEKLFAGSMLMGVIGCFEALRRKRPGNEPDRKNTSSSASILYSGIVLSHQSFESTSTNPSLRQDHTALNMDYLPELPGSRETPYGSESSLLESPVRSADEVGRANTQALSLDGRAESKGELPSAHSNVQRTSSPASLMTNSSNVGDDLEHNLDDNPHDPDVTLQDDTLVSIRIDPGQEPDTQSVETRLQVLPHTPNSNYFASEEGGLRSSTPKPRTDESYFRSHVKGDLQNVDTISAQAFGPTMSPPLTPDALSALSRDPEVGGSAGLLYSMQKTSNKVCAEHVMEGNQDAPPTAPERIVSVVTHSQQPHLRSRSLEDMKRNAIHTMSSNNSRKLRRTHSISSLTEAHVQPVATISVPSNIVGVYFNDGGIVDFQRSFNTCFNRPDRQRTKPKTYKRAQPRSGVALESGAGSTDDDLENKSQVDARDRKLSRKRALSPDTRGTPKVTSKRLHGAHYRAEKDITSVDNDQYNNSSSDHEHQLHLASLSSNGKRRRIVKPSANRPTVERPHYIHMLPYETSGSTTSSSVDDNYMGYPTSLSRFKRPPGLIKAIPDFHFASEYEQMGMARDNVPGASKSADPIIFGSSDSNEHEQRPVDPDRPSTGRRRRRAANSRSNTRLHVDSSTISANLDRYKRRRGLDSGAFLQASPMRRFSSKY